MVVDSFLRTNGTFVPNPAEVSKTESLVFWPARLNSIQFGVSFDELVDFNNTSTANGWMEAMKGASHLVTTNGHRVRVALMSSISQREQLEAYFHAMLVQHHLREKKSAEEALELAVHHHEDRWKAFQEICTSNRWNLDASELHSRGYEIGCPSSRS